MDEVGSYMICRPDMGQWPGVQAAASRTKHQQEVKISKRAASETLRV